MRLRVGRGRTEQIDEIDRRNLDLQAAPAAVDGDRGLQQRGPLDEERNTASLTERGNATDAIAGDPLGFRRGEHRGLLGAGRRRKPLEVQLAIACDQCADGDIARPGYQRLEQACRRNAERLRRLQADARSGRIVVVFVQL